MDTITQQQIDAFDALRGTKGPHAHLADRVEAIGLEVREGSGNNHRSEVVLQGAWDQDGNDLVVGEIVGDEEAEIR